MTENDLLAAVLSLAKLYGWRTLHIRPARTENGWRSPVQGDGKGFPDILAVKDDAFVAAELKADGKKPTREQVEWLFALSAATNSTTFCWTPKDWHDGSILAVFNGTYQGPTITPIYPAGPGGESTPE